MIGAGSFEPSYSTFLKIKTGPGFVVTLHEDTCEQEVQILRTKADVLDVLFARARVYCGNKIRPVYLNHDYNITFLLSLRKC